MVHLDELQEKYGAQGFTVLAVTNEAKSAVDGFITKNHPKYPMVIESSDSAEAFGISGFPSSFLIGSDGRIVWAGHPGNLTPQTIEDEITKVKLLPETPKKLEAIRTAIEKEKYADAEAKADKALADTSLTPEEKDAAQKLHDWVDWFAKLSIDTAKAMSEKGDYYSASLTLTDAVKSLKGLPASTEAADLLKAMQADPKQKEEIAAGDRLAKAKEKAKGEDPKKAILLFKPIASKYAETKAGAKAKDLIDELEKKEAAKEAKAKGGK